MYGYNKSIHFHSQYNFIDKMYTFLLLYEGRNGPKWWQYLFINIKLKKLNFLCISIDHRKENKLRGLNTEIDDHLKHIKLSNMMIMRWVYSPMRVGNNNHVETIHFH